MEFYEAVKRRCSVHSFRPDPIPEETLLRILHAGTLAPNAGNRQPWEFVVVTDRDLREKIAEIKVTKTEEVYKGIGTEEARSRVKRGFADQREAIVSAPVVLIVCYEKAKNLFTYASAWTCIENIVLAANAEGLGAITMAPRGEDEMRKILDIPDDYGIASIVPLGLPGEKLKHKPRVPVEEKMHPNKW